MEPDEHCMFTWDHWRKAKFQHVICFNRMVSDFDNLGVLINQKLTPSKGILVQLYSIPLKTLISVPNWLFFFFLIDPKHILSAAVWNCSHLLLTSLLAQLLAGYFALLGCLPPPLHPRRIEHIPFLFWGPCKFYFQGKKLWISCFISERRDQNIIVSFWVNDLFCLGKVKWEGLHTTKLSKALKNPCV